MGEAEDEEESISAGLLCFQSLLVYFGNIWRPGQRIYDRNRISNPPQRRTNYVTKGITTGHCLSGPKTQLEGEHVSRGGGSNKDWDLLG